MARGRILEKSISTSRKLSRVSLEAKLLFTWIIPHTDDFGHIEAEARIIKSIVLPLVDEIDNARVSVLIEELEKNNLVECYTGSDSEKYLEIVGFDRFQTFRVDRKRQAKYPKKPIGSTKDIPKGANRRVSEVKLSQGKRSKDIGASGDVVKDKKADEKTSEVAYLEDYFIKAAQAIQGVSKELIAINFPVVGKLIKTRLKQLEDAKVPDPVVSFEKLIVYFLSGKKWKKDEKQNWYMVPAEAPTMTNMLEARTWNKLMLLRTADRDFRTVIFNSADKLRQVFKQDAPDGEKQVLEIRKMLDQLAEKMHQKDYQPNK
jgi:hypothetical protein